MSPRGRVPDTVPMQLTLDPQGPPLHQQIYEALRAAIQRGALRTGDRLPSSRVLARDLGVSRTTVLEAFARLLSESYVTGNAGAGTRVAAPFASAIAGRHPTRDATPHVNGAARPVASTLADVESPRLSPAAHALFNEGKWRRMPLEAVPFAAGIPALELFPITTWARLTARRWRLSGKALLMPCDARGYEPLREAIAKYADTARGVRCTAEQVIIVNGAQHAIDLCARLLVGPGDDVWLESPGFPPARGMFAATGARLVDVPIDASGLDVAAGRAASPAARLAFVTPFYQSALGVTMSLERRLALLEWANEANAWIVEDDYSGDYRYGVTSATSIQGLDTNNRVLYIGTFTKTLSPALRLGYLILPPALVPVFARARLLLDRHSPVPDQAVLADFITGGHFARHIRRTRAKHQERQRMFLDLAAKELDGLLTFDEAPAGMRLIGWLPAGANDQRIAEEAVRRGVVVEALSRTVGNDELPPGLIFGFVAYSTTQTRSAMRVLAGVIRAVLD
ncbi:MAG: PLP-dependent aminotransferase family protein [bacterium]